jgi:hypothetical protein
MCLLLNLNSYITNTFFRFSLPRSIAVDNIKTSQMFLFWSVVSSGSYDIWGGTHASNTPKTKEDLQLRCLPHRDAWDKVICSADKETTFLNDSSRPNRHRCVAHMWKVGSPHILFGNKFYSNATGDDTSRATPCGQKERNITSGLGCQDCCGGVISTYVDLLSIQTVHLISKLSCGLTEEGVNVVSSMPPSTVDP